MPAGVLVVILLGALCVDSAVAYLGQQQLRSALVAAANDSAAAALQDSSFYRRGAVRVDPAAAARTVCADLAAQADSDLHGIRVWMSAGGNTVRLEGAATVDAVFGRAIPGFGRRHVRAAATAVAATGPSVPRVRPGVAPVLVACPAG